jgi:hypothetical protein
VVLSVPEPACENLLFGLYATAPKIECTSESSVQVGHDKRYRHTVHEAIHDAAMLDAGGPPSYSINVLFVKTVKLAQAEAASNQMGVHCQEACLVVAAGACYTRGNLQRRLLHPFLFFKKLFLLHLLATSHVFPIRRTPVQSGLGELH